MAGQVFEIYRNNEYYRYRTLEFTVKRAKCTLSHTSRSMPSTCHGMHWRVKMSTSCTVFLVQFSLSTTVQVHSIRIFGTSCIMSQKQKHQQVRVPFIQLINCRWNIFFVDIKLTHTAKRLTQSWHSRLFISNDWPTGIALELAIYMSFITWLFSLIDCGSYTTVSILLVFQYVYK